MTSYIIFGLFCVFLGLIIFDAINFKIFNAVKIFKVNKKKTVTQIKNTYISITFEVLGHVAKADGRVSEKEIATAKSIIEELDLDIVQKQSAIEKFHFGKSADFNLHKALNTLLHECKYDRNLLITFIDNQTKIAKADGNLDLKQKVVLETIYYYLGFIPNFNSSKKFAKGKSYKIDDAFHTLGLNSDADIKSIKRKYRKLMNDNHPDKLIAKGFSEQEIKSATEKTQQIKQSYETLREYKDF